MNPETRSISTGDLAFTAAEGTREWVDAAYRFVELPGVGNGEIC